jgi:hypothetical protein
LISYLDQHRVVSPATAIDHFWEVVPRFELATPGHAA